MTRSIYKTTREVAGIVTMVLCFYLLVNDETLRGLSVLFFGCWYIALSNLYQ